MSESKNLINIPEKELFARLREQHIQSIVVLLKRRFAPHDTAEFEQLIYNAASEIVDKTQDVLNERLTSMFLYGDETAKNKVQGILNLLPELK